MRIRSVTMALMAALLCGTAMAQEIAKRDLMPAVERKAAEEKAGDSAPDLKECGDKYDGLIYADGWVKNRDRGKLVTELADVSPATFAWGDKVTVTLRIRNVGNNPTLIPWATTPSDARVGQDPKDSQIDVMNFSATLAVDGREEDVADGDVALYAYQKRAATLLTLLPGNWATIRFSAAIECKHVWCKELHPGTRASLRIGTHEFLSTFYERKRCDFVKGTFLFRDLESRDIPVNFVVRAEGAH